MYVTTLYIIKFFLIYRIVSVSISPEFVKRKNLLSAAADGSVRQWIIEKYNYDRYHKIKSTHSLDIHLKNKEVRSTYYSKTSNSIF